MNTLRQSRESNSSGASVERAIRWRTSQAPPLPRSMTVREFLPGPPLEVTTVLPEALTTSPKGPEPVECCSPSAVMMRPPGRIDEAGRRRAGRMPAGAE